jgi:hypothetical protein
MATIAQIIVIKMSRTSMLARTLFFNPNWIGVNAKLKMRLRTNGRITTSGICF